MSKLARPLGTRSSSRLQAKKASIWTTPLLNLVLDNRPFSTPLEYIVPATPPAINQESDSESESSINLDLIIDTTETVEQRNQQTWHYQESDTDSESTIPTAPFGIKQETESDSTINNQQAWYYHKSDFASKTSASPEISLCYPPEDSSETTEVPDPIPEPIQAPDPTPEPPQSSFIPPLISPTVPTVIWINHPDRAPTLYALDWERVQQYMDYTIHWGSNLVDI